MSEVKLMVPNAPKELFKAEQNAPLLKERAIVHLIEKIEVKAYEGTLVWYQGAKQPKKGFPSPQALYALNQIKKIIIEGFSILNIFIALGIFISDKNRLLRSFNVIFDKIFLNFKIKDEYLCKSAFNLAKFVQGLLENLGIDKTIAYEFAFNIAQIIEYDDAYRYRVQDVMSEINNDNMLKNPRKELLRLMDIWQERDRPGVTAKMRKIITPITYFLYIPKFKKAFVSNVYSLHEMRYDDADWYWVCRRSDYNFGGVSYEERSKNNDELSTYEVEA